MTSPCIISGKQSWRGSFGVHYHGQLSAQLHLNLHSCINSEPDCGMVGKHYVRCTCLKTTQLPNIKSERLLDFDIHLRAGYLYYTWTSGLGMTIIVTCTHSHVLLVFGYAVLYMELPLQCCRTIGMFPPTLCCLNHRLTNHLCSLHSCSTTCLAAQWGVGFGCGQGL